jgi:hypothetical protein
LITFSFTRPLLIKQNLEDQIEFVPVNEKLKAFILSSWDDGTPCPLATQGSNGRYFASIRSKEKQPPPVTRITSAPPMIEIFFRELLY